MDFIRVRGARTHNLKNLCLDIPKLKLVVVTGLSGSGKSSLAFDTLYAEGQRRYVESLSAYARQFLDRLEKPDVDLIEGLSPAIAIEQKSASHNPRSTVGTITEIHDYLRLLYARVGTPMCPTHGIELNAQSVSQIVDTIMGWPDQTRVAVLAPIGEIVAVDLLDTFHNLQSQGFIRLRLNGTMVDADNLAEFDVNHPIPGQSDVSAGVATEVVIDRLRVRDDSTQRLADSVEVALKLAKGKLMALNMDQNTIEHFSSHFACPICHHTVTDLEPKLFSFNSPSGACPTCDGLGHVHEFDLNRVVAFPELSLKAGAIKGWDARNASTHSELTSLATHYKFDIDTPWQDLPQTVQQVVLYGSGQVALPFFYISPTGQSTVKSHPFEGVMPTLRRRFREADSPAVIEELNKYRLQVTCPSCQGARLCPAALNVLIGGLAIHQVQAMSLAQCLAWFEALVLTGAKHDIAQRIVQEITSRLTFLNNVGLTYLSLDRRADTLSGGEAQRIRLASQIGSGLTGVMYVLDEPSIGLHQRDNDRLIQTLLHLKNLGNSVLVVEHDEDMIRQADWVIDMGPGAGEHGGQIVAQGTPHDILANTVSLTGQYLSGLRKIETLSHRRVTKSTPRLTVLGCTGNNLKSVDLSIPVGHLIGITGVSGSGKSTLINDTLGLAMARALHRAHTEPASYVDLQGVNLFDKIITVDQSPIGRTPRSNPATYTGMFTPIRELFAQVPEAKIRGYDPGRFSFNVKGGRCETCQGDGVVKVEMHFLPDVYVTCDACHGKRYNRETLEIRYRGRNIHEVLEMTVEQALGYFEAIPSVERKLQTLMDVGLSYIRIGQSATTLSGGEAQRVKLSLELSKRSTGQTLFILDEPTTGLHFKDISMLLKVLNQLVDAGNTVVVIEHNLDVIKTADWIIDLGPEGGDGGGRIIAQGPPQSIASNPVSVTGQYLKRYFT